MEIADWRPNLHGLVFYSLDPISVSRLERPFEINEVYQVVCGMVKDKSPAPDGFSMAFSQAYWDVVQEDVMRVSGIIFLS